MRARITGLSRQSKAGRTSRSLLAAIDVVRLSAPDSEERRRNVRVIAHRVVMLKNGVGKLNSDQERDALTIILFIEQAMNIGELRTQACAVIALRGSEKARDEICALFPGLERMFD